MSGKKHLLTLARLVYTKIISSSLFFSFLFFLSDLFFSSLPLLFYCYLFCWQLQHKRFKRTNLSARARETEFFTPLSPEVRYARA